MVQAPKNPYLTAVLHAPVPELDLSSSRSFRLELIVTLHASNPIPLYTADTSLSSQAVLRQGGIVLVRKNGGLTPEARSTVDVNTGHGPDRPWVLNSILILEPETLTWIQISFNSRKPAIASQDGHFDYRPWMSTATFQTGIAYKAICLRETKSPGGAGQHKTMTTITKACLLFQIMSTYLSVSSMTMSPLRVSASTYCHLAKILAEEPL